MNNSPLTTIIEETSSAGTTTTQEPSSTPPGSVQQEIVPDDTDDWHCSDFLHCLGAGDPEGIVQCDAATEQDCPGLAALLLPTPNSYVNNGIHAGEHRTRTCGNCRLHEGHPLYPNRLALIDSDSNVLPGSGIRSQLCRSCIYDEVELYWLRQGTARPTNAGSSPHIRQWPAPNGIQNLCMCEGYTINFFGTSCCHACRDAAFFHFCYNPFQMTEDVLHSCTQPVIRGARIYVNQDHGRSMRVSAATVLRRRDQGIGRMCPCGNKPKRPTPQEYITYCMACLGVRIIPNFLPRDLRQGPVMARHERRQSLRNRGFKRTKGPAAAQRHPTYRVNIERAWLAPDPDIGGT
ncbi:hypothetical protein COCMIDRAFT_85358 [Bipolaris oryzae ATCC 44560]|uniref:Uncharacterized protein n=1 Tax=Bipolaris oryzae ATCC 44560 TaxID=930090 RepID=W6ZBH7_COCMI|nr:uncharacterized protein COCMIDRAFT_85358 [Bipolaris oryzae ATCC 44560]EUC49157.1 hypothetical protein COCMIDRAFT_85358 [Bipolaris oryzae ATCC 44560]